MSSKLEQVMQMHLLSGKSLEGLIYELQKKIIANQLSAEDRIRGLDFMWNAGYYEIILQTAITLLEANQKLPFAHIIEVLAKHNIKPSKAELSALFKGVQKQDAADLLEHSHSWDPEDEKFTEVHRRFAQEREQAYMRQKEILSEKLSFFRNQRMIHEEAKLLKLLLRLYPNDPQIQSEKQEHEERWARQILAEKAMPSWDNAGDYTHSLHQPEELAVGQIIADAMREIVKSKTNTAYNFALTLLFVELYKEAIDIISHGPTDLASEWLQIELHLLERRFVDALALIQKIELAHSSDPEVSFACIYARAKAYRGLGHSGQAVELLKGLVSVRPNYRSAQSLLTDWSGGGIS